MLKLLQRHPSALRRIILLARIWLRSPIFIHSPPIPLLLQLLPLPLGILLLLLPPVRYRPPPLLPRPILLIPSSMRIHARIHRQPLLPTHYRYCERSPCSACCEFADLRPAVAAHVFVVDVADLGLLCGVEGNGACRADVDGLGYGLRRWWYYWCR